MALPFSALMLTALAAAPALRAQNVQISKDNRTIAITSTDSAEMDADTAEISIGFIAYGPRQQDLYAEATATSNDIIDGLIAAGVAREQIRSVAQNLSAIDTEDKLRYGQGVRFTFSQSWKVTARAADADKILHTAINAGANQSGAIDWRLADDNALQASAAAKALAHARQIAQSMAGGLNAKLGTLIYASNQQPQQFRYGMVLNTESASISDVKSKNLKPLAILPDKVSRSATVYAVFALEP